ncbi:hypothetical protein PTTG_04213 [Puccinia triticina 1-1 BBBD Race 1]|uniref:Uncharacterized protein n=1 Tax=Puccinia triticina (isolate 1-1 / race 1 (BBBD)) TaxID=630390 RepID=A0A0C4ETT4_PUCT1|nr:hypothetical protein PTTG_04213 [Puccinia triticina 1-1 BBBD Race 1]
MNTDLNRQQSAIGNLPFSNRTGVVMGGEDVPSDLQSLVSSSILKKSIPSLNTNHLSKAATENANDDQTQTSKNPGLPFDEEAKLVYGVVFSLRNMVQKLAGNVHVTCPHYTHKSYIYPFHFPDDRKFETGPQNVMEDCLAGLCELSQWIPATRRNVSKVMVYKSAGSGPSAILAWVIGAA